MTGSKIRSFFLGEAAKSKEERRLVQKIDFFILVLRTLSSLAQGLTYCRHTAV
ncbi:hypothetical protein EDB80DRAFT_718658 [Ilyonectria destructans]|nr:hypothetical protein EDB80DRAFT_718658 [Ilyonectria destructans]